MIMIIVYTRTFFVPLGIQILQVFACTQMRCTEMARTYI